MSEKKIVRRSVAIALGIICIVLIGGLGGAMLYTVTLFNDKDKQIDSLNTQISTLNNTISSLNSQISQLNSNVTNLQNQAASLNTTINSLNSNLTNLQKIVNMQESTVLYNGSIPNHDLIGNASGFHIYEWWILLDNLPDGFLEANPVHTDYAGYVVVNVMNSTIINGTFVELNYSSNGFSYESKMSISSSGSEYFPILPTTSLIIVVGNTDTSVDTNITNVTVTYYY